jgi:hypothetical protein
MATKKTAPKKMGRPANKYIAVTVYLSFDPDAKLKDMMSIGSSFGNEAGSIDTGSANATVSKVTVKKSDGPYPKKAPKAPAKKAAVKAAVATLKKAAAKKPAAKKPRKKG